MNALDSKYKLQDDLPVRTRNRSATSPTLPEIPGTELGLGMELEWTLNTIMPPSDPATAKVHKRASNVMKLAQENEKLRAELKGMTDRLEAAERKRQEMARIEEQARMDEEEEAEQEAEKVEEDAPIADEGQDVESGDEESDVSSDEEDSGAFEPAASSVQEDISS